jgi:heavy metal sensor kinase
MFSALLKQAARTIRFRLMIWNAAVVVVTAGLTLVGMQIGVRQALLHEVDTFLLDDLDALTESVLADADSFTPQSRKRSPSWLQRHGHGRFVTLLDRQGNFLWASDDQPMDLPPEMPLTNFGPAYIGEYRVAQRAVNDDAGRPLLVRVGIPRTVLDEDISRVDFLAMEVATIALVISLPLGYWLARRVVRVLGDMTQRTGDLRPMQLDERLPIRGTGDELDQLATTINGLLDRIASYLSRREDFVANAAHELRTPVAAIRSTAEVALGAPRSQGDYEQFLEDVIEECATLEYLVNQLLLLAEGDAQRLRVHWQQLAFDEIVTQCCDMFEALAETLQLELHVETIPTTVAGGNRHHLRQVLNNLLDNAIKFTPPGGRIDVRLWHDHDLQQAVLTVSNTGPGVDPEGISRIFDRFYQADKARHRDQARRGTGLGLSICKTIVEAHGGTIMAESVPDQLTTFTVRLPLAT